MRPEFSPRAIVCAVIVAAVIGGSYPYIVLKLGFGPNISVVSAFFGYLLAAGILRIKTFNRWENNMVQTAGTAAGHTAFMCVLLAAFDMLNAKPELGVHIHLSFWQVFSWLVLTGGMGVLAAVPMRRHFVDEEQLTYADGVAAAETLTVLDSGGAEARRRARALSLGAVSAIVLTWFRDGWGRLLKKLLSTSKISEHTFTLLGKLEHSGVVVLLGSAGRATARPGAALRHKLVAAVDRIGDAGRRAHQRGDGPRHGCLVADRAAASARARNRRRAQLSIGAALGDVAGDRA